MPSTCSLAWSWTAVLLALAGCGADAPGSCRIETAVDMPLLDHTSLPTVIGRLRGQPVALMLDTGAHDTVATSSAVDRFGLSVDPNNVITMSGIGGTVQTKSASIHGLQLGQGHAHDFDLPIATDLPEQIQNLPVLGLFGADFMSNYDVDFDLPRHHFGMYDLSGCGDAIQPVPTPYYEVPFRLEDTKIAIEIQLDGVPVEAVLDSGAGSTYITEADARRAGVTQDMLAADRVEHARGVDGFPVQGHLHRFASLELGAERLKNFPLLVASSAVGDTLLGDDFFRLNRIWISYSRRMLFIQPALGNPLFHMTDIRTP